MQSAFTIVCFRFAEIAGGLIVAVDEDQLLRLE